MQATVFSAKIEQGVAMRLELRAHYPTDEDEMVARFVQRFVLALERDERAA